MSLWSLATDGRHDDVALGMPIDEVIERYGTPTQLARDRRGRLTIAKYDAIELHAHRTLLWLVYCEFGTPPFAPSVSSVRLGIEPGPFQWPIDSDAVFQAAQAADLEVTVGDKLGSSTPVARFGFAEFSVDLDEKICVLSISRE